jgi:hypothetical protein
VACRRAHAARAPWQNVTDPDPAVWAAKVRADAALCRQVGLEREARELEELTIEH